MTDGLTELRQRATEAYADSAIQSYTDLDPLRYFAEGGEIARRRLLTLDRSKDFAQAQNVSTLVGAGWLALEIGAMTSATNPRLAYFGQAADRFSQVVNHSAQTGMESVANYQAGMGLLTVNAYRDRVESSNEAAPKLYTQLLEDLLVDDMLRSVLPERADELIDQLTFATFASKLGHFVLPASVRHTSPRTQAKPQVSYDFLLWNASETFPGRPDRTVKIKPPYIPGEKPHAGHLTILRPSELSEDTHKLAADVAAFYPGQRLEPASRARIRTAKRRLGNALARAPKPSKKIGFQDEAIRSSHKGDSTVFRGRPNKR